MKRLIFISLFAFVALALSAQSGRIKTLTIDTLKGNNDDTLATVYSSGSYDILLFEVTFNKVSAAAGGTAYLKGGLTTPIVLNEDNSGVKFSTNDTLTITDGAVWRVEIQDPADYKYFIYGDGDANDTVKVTTRYMYKK